MAESRELAIRFDEELRRVAHAICERPKSYPHRGRGVRTTTLKSFPYRLYFNFDADLDVVNILAIYHVKRNPKRWNNPTRD